MSDTSEIQQVNIDSTLQETRVFETSPEFSKHAHIKSQEDYERIFAEAKAIRKNSGQASRRSCTGSSRGTKFWSGIRRGRSGLSAARSIFRYNCLDRHVADLAQEQGRNHLGEANRAKFARSPISNCCVKSEVRQCAEESLGIKKGDRVAIYMGMTPELAIAMLACARIGAAHSVIFGGFSANALVDRINDRKSVAVITQDGVIPSRHRGSAEGHCRRSAEELPVA